MKKLIAILLLLSPALLHAAEEGDPVVAKLREALRNTMLQMRDVQGQLANAQAAQIASDAKVKELTAQNDKLTKQMIEDKNASTNTIAELNTRLEEQGVVIQKLNATVDQWKRGYNEATALAQKKEAERAKAAAQIIKLDRIVADQQIKNVQMYKVGTEILDRYEKFGLGEAILAREPFVGMTRAKFQTLMQDYQDKLVDQRISSTSTGSTPPPAIATAALPAPPLPAAMKAVTISLILLAAALTARAQDATTVIAKVGDTELKAKDLAPYLASLSADDRAALTKNPALLNQVVRSLILQQVLVKEALSANWDKRPEVVEQLERLRKNAIAEDYLVTVAKVPDNYPGDTEVKAAYDARKDQLQLPRQYQLAQIFIASDDANAQANLDAVAKALKAANADFAAIAKDKSQEPQSAARGGEIGWLTAAAVQPEIRDRLANASKGAVTEAIRLPDGWHIIKVLDVREPRTATLEEVKPRLVEVLRNERAKSNRDAYLAQLQQKNPVSLNELALSTLLNDTGKN